MSLECQAKCPHCNKQSLTLHVCEAAHDPDLFDLVLECCSCGRQLNAFVSICNDMTVLTPGDGEVL